MAKIEELLSNGEFMLELSKKKNYNEVTELFLQNGITVTKDDIDELTVALKFFLDQKEELSEGDLNDVAGGAWYKYQCSCGRKFRTDYFAGLHMGWKNLKAMTCSGGSHGGGFAFCTTDGARHVINSID